MAGGYVVVWCEPVGTALPKERCGLPSRAWVFPVQKRVYAFRALMEYRCFVACFA